MLIFSATSVHATPTIVFLKVKGGTVYVDAAKTYRRVTVWLQPFLFSRPQDYEWSGVRLNQLSWNVILNLLRRKLCGPQIRSGSFLEREFSYLYREQNKGSSFLPTCNPVTIPATCCFYFLEILQLLTFSFLLCLQFCQLFQNYPQIFFFIYCLSYTFFVARSTGLTTGVSTAS